MPEEDPTAILLLVPPAYRQVGACESLNPVTFIPELFVDHLSEHNVSLLCGLDYKPAAGTLVYASVSRGYKAGTYSAVAASINLQLEPVPQEQVTAYEVGVKSDIIPRLLHVNAAVFYYDYVNKQLQGTIVVPIIGAIQRLVSIPKSRIAGAEADVSLHPATGVTLGANLTYVDTKITASSLQLSPAIFAACPLPTRPSGRDRSTANTATL